MGGRDRGVALALFAATAAVGGSAAVATAITGDVPGNADSWPTGLFATALGLTGLLIRWRHPDHRCGWSLQIGGLLAAIGFSANWWAGQTLYRDPGSLPGGGFAAWVALWVYPLYVWFGFTWPLVLFPSGRPRSSRWRIFGVVAAIATGSGALGAALFGAVAATSEAPIELLDIPEFPADGWAQPALAFAAAGSVAASLAALIALAGVAVASRRARGDEWYQLQWLLLGGAVAVAPTLIDLVIIGSELPQEARTLALLAIPASMVLAMAHHHLYDVDLVISRSVTTAAVVAAIAVVYVGVVWALATLLGQGVRCAVLRWSRPRSSP